MTKRDFESKYSFITPINATFMYINTIIHRHYMFRRHLRHPQGAKYQDLELPEK